MEERKAWLDNIRWMTIVLVVIYHVFYYYHNIGIDPMFKALAPNPAVEGEKAGGGVFRLCCAVLCCQALPRFPPLGDQSRDSGLLLLAVRDDRVHAGELSRGRVQL